MEGNGTPWTFMPAIRARLIGGKERERERVSSNFDTISSANTRDDIQKNKKTGVGTDFRIM